MPLGNYYLEVERGPRALVVWFYGQTMTVPVEEGFNLLRVRYDGAHHRLRVHYVGKSTSPAREGPAIAEEVRFNRE